MPVTIERPILRIGRWDASTGPFVCTQAGLDHLLARFQAPDTHTPSVKLGHWSHFSGEWDDGIPAFGWVTGLRQDGDTLVAHLALIEQSAERLGLDLSAVDLQYPRGSVELHRKDVDDPDSLVLDCFALLGSVEPAVNGIETGALDALAPTGDGWTIRPANTAIAASANGRFRVEVAATKNAPVKAGSRERIPTKGPHMPELTTAVLAALGLEDSADEATVLAAIETAKKPVTASATATTTGSTDEKPDTTTVDTSALAELQTWNATLEARIASIEAERNVTASIAVVDEALAAGKVVAASRDAWLKAAEKDVEGTRALLAAMPSIVPVAALGHTTKPTTGGTIAGSNRADALAFMTGRPAADFQGN